MEAKYYDGTKLLSLLDIDGNKPEVYICTTNRTGGKTTYFGRLLVNRFIDKGEKFGLIYRYNYELEDIADKFFKELGTLFFQGMDFTSEIKMKGKYAELYLNNKSCGYAFSLNDADALKKMSHLFSDTKRMLFDEFQSETNKYCTREVTKFMSLHTTVARGKGEQSRYVPVFMVSNPITILNPYYTEMQITSRLNDNVNFLRGHGWVLEQGYVESASVALSQSGFMKAFEGNKYSGYASQGVYLNDNLAFIEKVQGKNYYIATIKYNGKDYGLRAFPDLGYIYCDDRPDNTSRQRIAITTEDHQINYVMLKQNNEFFKNLRYYFDKGCFRFKDLSCKEMIVKVLSY